MALKKTYKSQIIYKQNSFEKMSFLIFPHFHFTIVFIIKLKLLRINVFFNCFRIGSFSIASIKETTLQLHDNISNGSWKKNDLIRVHFLAVFGDDSTTRPC